MEQENSGLLDKDGNPITKERIEEVFREQFKDDDLGIKYYEGPGYEYWVVKTPASDGRRATSVIMGKAAFKQFNDAIKMDIQNENMKFWEDATKKNNDKERKLPVKKNRKNKK